MKFTATILISLALASFAGCATTTGAEISEAQATQFKEGKTTEAEVLAKLGKPTAVSTSGGKRTLEYTFGQSKAKAATFIPIAGIFMGGSDYKTTQATYEFNSRGILQKASYTSTGGEVKAGSAR